MSLVVARNRHIAHNNVVRRDAITLAPQVSRRGVAKRTCGTIVHAAPAAVATVMAPPAPVATLLMETNLSDLSTAYSRAMKDAMGWGDRPFDYSYERGLYYHEIIPNLFCGSQPRHKGDVQELQRDLNVTNILSLQQDKDMHHWGVNPDEVRQCCQSLRIDLMRRPVQDFDPHSLRKTLPSAVQALHGALSNGGKVYVHCTAGLGRAPAVIIAYLYWFRGLPLHQAYDYLTSIRPCGPKKEAIRGATFDLMSGQAQDQFNHVPSDAYTNLTDEDRYALQWRVMRI